MIRKVVMGGALGAIILSFWAAFSWTVLPWHGFFMNKFKDEELVCQTIQNNVNTSGVYILPCFDDKKEAKKGDVALSDPFDREERIWGRKPFIFAIVSLKGMDFYNPVLYLSSFIIHFIGAALMSYLLLHTSDRYGKRLLAVTMTGLIIGIVVYLPGWNWFGDGHNYRFVSVMIADYLISWFLMGLLLAACIKPSKKIERS